MWLNTLFFVNFSFQLDFMVISEANLETILMFHTENMLSLHLPVNFSAEPRYDAIFIYL